MSLLESYIKLKTDQQIVEIPTTVAGGQVVNRTIAYVIKRSTNPNENSERQRQWKLRQTETMKTQRDRDNENSERERERQTDRQTDRQTERDRDRDRVTSNGAVSQGLHSAPMQSRHLDPSETLVSGSSNWTDCPACRTAADWKRNVVRSAWGLRHNYRPLPRRQSTGVAIQKPALLPPPPPLLPPHPSPSPPRPPPSLGPPT